MGTTSTDTLTDTIHRDPRTGIEVSPLGCMRERSILCRCGASTVNHSARCNDCIGDSVTVIETAAVL